MVYTEEMTTSEILLQLASMRNELLQAINDIEKISKNICYKAEQTEPQTDIHDLTDCDFCKERNCKDCEGGKDEPQTDCTEALTLLWIKNMVTDEEFYCIDARLKCISCKWWNDTIVGGSECVSKECTYEPKDESQTDCGDFADRLAYERGVKHAWEVAQKVFDSTVTFYEAEDVAKQIADTPQTENPCDGCVCDDGKHLMYCMNCKGIAWKTEPPKLADTPQTEQTESSLEQFRVGLEYHTDAMHFGKAKGESITTDKTEPKGERIK